MFSPEFKASLFKIDSILFYSILFYSIRQVISDFTKMTVKNQESTRINDNNHNAA